MPNIVPLDMPAAYWLDKARHAGRIGDYSEAVRLFKAALRKHDDNATRRELAALYADMHSFLTSERIYTENLARDPSDAESVYGLARSRSLAGDERTMAELLDTYLRAAPCGTQADHARDILWHIPREDKTPPRMHRAQVLCSQSAENRDNPKIAMSRAKRSWRHGKTPECARLLCSLYLQCRMPRKALQYAYFACRMQPQELSSRLMLAQALRAADMPQASRSALVQAEPLCTSYVGFIDYFQMAVMLDFPDLAEQAVQKRLQEHPYSIDYLMMLAMTLYAQGKDRSREENALQQAQFLDNDSHLAADLLKLPWHEGAMPFHRVMQQYTILEGKQAEAQSNGASTPEQLHRQLVDLMHLPIPGVYEAAVQIMMQVRDAQGLRLALLENGITPLLCGQILDALEKMGEPLPCYARPEGRLCLVPPRRRPPCDADLYDLVHDLLRISRGRVPLDEIVSRVPRLWQQLPEGARRHYAKCQDLVWPTAFLAYLTLQGGHPEGAEQILNHSPRSKRVRRAYRQLSKRSSMIHEVY